MKNNSGNNINPIFKKINITRNEVSKSSLDQRIELYQSSVELIQSKINKLYERPSSNYTHKIKAQVKKKEKDLMTSMTKLEKRNFLIKKKLYCVLSPFEDEDRLVNDLIRLSNLRSLSELVNLNSDRKTKKDIFRIFKLKRLEKERAEKAAAAGEGGTISLQASSPQSGGISIDGKVSTPKKNRFSCPISPVKAHKTSRYLITDKHTSGNLKVCNTTTFKQIGNLTTGRFTKVISPIVTNITTRSINKATIDYEGITRTTTPNRTSNISIFRNSSKTAAIKAHPMHRKFPSAFY
jgi:hypothetical protein